MALPAAVLFDMDGTLVDTEPYWIETEFELASGEVITRLNGEERQRGRFADMIFDVPFLIEYISSVFTLLPGDVILTGTPEGVGPFQAGDTVEVEIPGIGTLRNTARDAA